MNLFIVMGVVGENGRVLELEDVDVKDLFEMGRIVVESLVLKEMIKWYRSDLVMSIFLFGQKNIKEIIMGIVVYLFSKVLYIQFRVDGGFGLYYILKEILLNQGQLLYVNCYYFGSYVLFGLLFVFFLGFCLYNFRQMLQRVFKDFVVLLDDFCYEDCCQCLIIVLCGW